MMHTTKLVVPRFPQLKLHTQPQIHDTFPSCDPFTQVEVF
jgi:hypothetical protein